MTFSTYDMIRTNLQRHLCFSNELKIQQSNCGEEILQSGRAEGEILENKIKF